MEKNQSASLPKKEIDHVIKARIRGKAVASEFTEEKIPQHLSSAFDGANELVILLLILWIVLQKFSFSSFSLFLVFLLVSFSFLLWKSSRSAYLGWISLQKLHKVIKEEKWEIEHHRLQERKELETLYKAKGFKGKLLDDVVDTLMADDNRLLQIMLEEEMGIALESFEHPLKQAAGAALGVLGSFCLLIFAIWLFPFFGIFLASFLIFVGTAFFSSRYLRINLTPPLIWHLAIAFLVVALTYFATEILGAYLTS